MTARDELAALVWAGVMEYERQPESCYIEPEDRLKIADAILAAGWRAPTSRVWVVTEDGYEGTGIAGVYRTAELAAAAVHKVRTTPVEYYGGRMGRSQRIFNIDEHDVHDDDDLDR